MRTSASKTSLQLWFDVEKKYKTIEALRTEYEKGLWFDVEKKYKTIKLGSECLIERCGLM